MATFVLAEFRKSGDKYNRALPRAHDKRDDWAASDIYGKYPDRYGEIFDAYHADEFFEKWGWSLQYLAKNIDQIANRTKRKEMTDEDVPW